MIRLLTSGKRFVQLTRGYTWRPRRSGPLLPPAFSIPRGLCFIDGLRRFTLVQADRIQFLRPRLVSGVCSQQIDFASYYSDCNLNHARSHQTRSLSRYLRIVRIYNIMYAGITARFEVYGTSQCHAEI